MADAIRYVYNHCQHSIQAWSDGNPYYIDEIGQKQYAYHPDHQGLARCIGNDAPHLCLACGHGFQVDSREPASACPTCGASQFVDTYHLKGCSCPYCRTGQFLADPNFLCIS